MESTLRAERTFPNKGKAIFSIFSSKVHTLEKINLIKKHSLLRQ